MTGASDDTAAPASAGAPTDSHLLVALHRELRGLVHRFDTSGAEPDPLPDASGASRVTITPEQTEAACRVWFGEWSWHLLAEDVAALAQEWETWDMSGRDGREPLTCRAEQRIRMAAALTAAMQAAQQRDAGPASGA